MEEQIAEKNIRKACAIPVFSVKKCINPSASKGQSFAYSSVDFKSDTEHGDFELSTGIFSVKTPGIYQFQFNGYIEKNLNESIPSCNFQFELRVDGIMKPSSYTSAASSFNAGSCYASDDYYENGYSTGSLVVLVLVESNQLPFQLFCL